MTLPDYLQQAMPLYNASTGSAADALRRSILNLDLMFHFFRDEGRRFDFLPELGRLRCPTLVLGGALDPVCPIEDQAEIAAALPPALVRFERFENAGHGVYRDEPERAFQVLREFLASLPGSFMSALLRTPLATDLRDLLPPAASTYCQVRLRRPPVRGPRISIAIGVLATGFMNNPG